MFCKFFSQNTKKQKKNLHLQKKQKEPREQLLTLKVKQIRHYHKNK